MIQAVAYVLFIIGLIFGVWLAKTFDMVSNNPTQTIQEKAPDSY